MKAVQIERHGQIQRDGTSYIVATSDELQRDELMIITQLANASEGLKAKASNL